MINTVSYGSESVHFFKSFVHVCNAAGVPVIKSENIGLIYRYNSAIFVCLSQSRAWISIVLCSWVFFCVQWVTVVGDCFFVVDIGEIDEHHCFNNCSSHILK